MFLSQIHNEIFLHKASRASRHTLHMRATCGFLVPWVLNAVKVLVGGLDKQEFDVLIIFFWNSMSCLDDASVLRIFCCFNLTHFFKKFLMDIALVVSSAP